MLIKEVNSSFLVIAVHQQKHEDRKFCVLNSEHCAWAASLFKEQGLAVYPLNQECRQSCECGVERQADVWLLQMCVFYFVVFLLGFFFPFRLLSVHISILWLICAQTNSLCIFNEILQKSMIKDKSDVLQRNKSLKLCLNIFLTNVDRYSLLLRLLIDQSTLQKCIYYQVINEM